MFRLTETLEERQVNRSKIEQIRFLAWDALYRMGAEPTLGWKHFRSIRNWDGTKHLVLRSNGNAITLEKL